MTDTIAKIHRAMGNMVTRPAGSGYLGKGDNSGVIVADITKRRLWVQTNKGEPPTPVPLLDTINILPYIGVHPELDGIRVDLGYPPSRSDVLHIIGLDQGEGLQSVGGITPAEQLLAKAQYSDIGSLINFRLAPNDPVDSEVYINPGWYKDASGIPAYWGGDSTATLLTDAIAALSSGEHQMAVPYIDNATGLPAIITNTAAAGGVNDKQTFDTTTIVEMAHSAGEVIVGAVHLYYGQTTITEDDIYRSSDPRIVFEATGGGGITELTGDIAAGPGSGSQAATLATVNADVGSFTNPNITVNAKGLITAASNGSGGGMTSFDVTADTGAPETISDGETLTIAGGTGIDTVVSATDTVTVAIDSTVATLTGAQTLANKVLSQLHLLIGGFKAIFTHAFTADRTVTLPGDADVTLVGVATAQTLTNKTLITPAIGDYTNAQHDHADADAGGNITGAAFGTQVKNRVLVGPVTGADATPTFRILETEDIGGAIQIGNLANVITYEDFDPGVSEDGGAGYLTGHWWINVLTQQVFQSVDDAAGAAVWKRLSDPSSTAGDTTYYDGADTVALPLGTAGQYLRVNAGATAPEWANPTVIDWQYFGTPGATTWTKPARAYAVRVICVGGGSGGGSGFRRVTGLARGGGAGGAAGGVTDVTYAASQLGSTEPLTVGAGGNGGIAITANDTQGNPGIQGGDTYFGGTTAANSIQMAVSAPGVLGGGRGGTGAATSDGGVGSIAFGPSVQFYGSSGGAVNSVTPAAAPTGAFGPGGGGGGGGLTSVNAAVTGADGASAQGAAFRPPATGGGGVANAGLNGSAGADGITDGTSTQIFGAGGGGGSGNVAGTGRNGGYGGRPGGGGGGGSASNNGSNSGAGGNGGDGGVFVISYCL